MMLNKVIREALVKRIMSDVPEVDYMTQATDLIAKFVKENTPAQITKILNSELKDWVMPGNTHYAKYLGYFNIRVPSTTEGFQTLEEKLAELGDKQSNQSDERNSLRAKIQANIDTCKTAKELAERFPDFVKYLPVDTKDALLPATTQLLDTLKAAGWPGNSEVKTAKTRKAS
ncbi:MAG: Nmad5 family putative nucleotide modification protein [Cloacibacterium sp.]|uniref:hypothetical protein n=1 Tax=Cloacibacterium sp. TaxID=1913682 RepID=UPI003C72CECD